MGPVDDRSPVPDLGEAVPESSHLAAVPSAAADPSAPGRATTGPRTVSAPLPPEVRPTPEGAPDLLAALDRGDEQAVYAWFRAHTPETSSLAMYGLLLAVGAAGLVEWPALALSALAQLIVDRRLGGIENVVAELRALAERPATA